MYPPANAIVASAIEPCASATMTMAFLDHELLLVLYFANGIQWAMRPIPARSFTCKRTVTPMIEYRLVIPIVVFKCCAKTHVRIMSAMNACAAKGSRNHGGNASHSSIIR